MNSPIAMLSAHSPDSQPRLDSLEFSGTRLTTDAARPSPVGASLFLVVSAGAVPALLVGNTPDSSGPWNSFLLVTLLAAVRLSILYHRGEPALYELVFWIFTYIFLGLAPIAQIRMDAYPETTPGVVTELLPQSAEIVLVGCLAFMLGARFSRETGEVGHPRVLSPRRAWTVAIPGLILALALTVSVGLGVHFESRAALGAARGAVLPADALGIIIQCACTVPLMAATIAFIRLRRVNQGFAVTAVLIIQMSLLLATTNPISSARIGFGTVSLALIAALGAFATPRRFRASLAAVLAGMILVFPYADAFRRGPDAQFSKGGPISAMTRGDFDSMAQINNTVWYVERHGNSMGRQAAGAVLFWVPRDLWKDKPLDTGIVLARDRGYRFENLSAPLWAELFINASWAGLVVGMTALGWLLRRFDLRRIRYGDVTIADVVLPFFLLMLLRGSLLQAMAVLIAITVISLYLSPRTSSPSPDAVRTPGRAGATEARTVDSS